MKKMDEMDRDIQLRAEEWGYKTVLLALCAWTILNVYQSLTNHIKLDMLPCLILCLTVCVQTLSQMIMKRKMVAGDDTLFSGAGMFSSTALFSLITLFSLTFVGIMILLFKI